MNTTQTLAWIICLVLAFVAAIMAARANYQAALTERRFEQVQRVVNDRQELLEQIRDVLQRIEQHMGGQMPATEAAPAEQAADAAAQAERAPDAETSATYKAAQ